MNYLLDNQRLHRAHQRRQALRHDATLVTANTAEFSRVSDLRWEDWASPT